MLWKYHGNFNVFPPFMVFMISLHLSNKFDSILRDLVLFNTKFNSIGHENLFAETVVSIDVHFSPKIEIPLNLRRSDSLDTYFTLPKYIDNLDNVFEYLNGRKQTYALKRARSKNYCFSSNFIQTGIKVVRMVGIVFKHEVTSNFKAKYHV